MSDKTFQEMVDEAVDKAVARHIDELARTALDQEHLCTVPEIARIAGFSEMTIRNWINRKRQPLPAYQVDKDYRIKLADYRAWMEEARTVGRVEKLIEIESA